MAPLRDVVSFVFAWRYGLRVERFEPAGRYWLRIERFRRTRRSLCCGRVVKGAQRQDSEAGKQHGPAHGAPGPPKFWHRSGPSARMAVRLLVGGERMLPLVATVSSVAYTSPTSVVRSVVATVEIVGTTTASCLCKALRRG